MNISFKQFLQFLIVTVFICGISQYFFSMPFSNLSLNFIKPFVKKHEVSGEGDLIIHRLLVRSKFLDKKMRVDIYLPNNYHEFRPEFYPALVINDGQDMEALQLTSTLSKMMQYGEIPEIVTIAVHAADRMQEYGIAGRPDYKIRGSRADKYADFITKELMPYIYKNYRCLKNANDNVIAGFSLGGLSAMDLALNYPHWFSKVGVFSGSFWWRDKEANVENPDANRIMIDVLENSQKRKPIQFWLEAGTEDEKDDRNNNGVIDAIDDTLDVIQSLRNLGYEENDIEYVEIVGGEHNFDTWSKVFPKFLLWAFPQKQILSKKSA
jgi:enterochelin esterase-like enzyme